jgi:hypothetical protein
MAQEKKHGMNNRIQTHIQKMDAATQTALMPFIATPSTDEWVRDVLLCYFNYFLDIDEKRETERIARNHLRASLKHLVPVGMRRSLDKAEDFLHHEFRRKGYSFLGGMTGPYYGPYIWKRTERHTFAVELPDRHVSINVFFMHEFLAKSWMNFQTFGKSGTGGWVKRGDTSWEDGLYCVADAYDIERLADDPIFQISLLKHEAQHFSDKSDFPNLSSVDLEYRAKLTELIYFSEMKYRLASIIHEAFPAKTDPHRYASHWIVKRLSEKILNKPYVNEEGLWRSVPYKSIQTEALGLLQAHTQQLRANPINQKGILKGM